MIVSLSYILVVVPLLVELAGYNNYSSICQQGLRPKILTLIGTSVRKKLVRD